jgi:hypothetical protein
MAETSAHPVCAGARRGGGVAMIPDDLVQELCLIVEDVCAPVYNRDTGLQEPVSRGQWLALKERLDLLCAAYTPREAVNG